MGLMTLLIFGRRRVPWWVIDARRNLSGVCSRWRPIVLAYHRFFESGCAYHGITDFVTNTLMKVQHVAVSENSVHNSCVPRSASVSSTAAPENLPDPHNRDRPPKNELELGCLDDLLNSLNSHCSAKGKSTASDGLQLRETTVFCTITPCLASLLYRYFKGCG